MREGRVSESVMTFVGIAVAHGVEDRKGQCVFSGTRLLKIADVTSQVRHTTSDFWSLSKCVMKSLMLNFSMISLKNVDWRFRIGL